MVQLVSQLRSRLRPALRPRGREGFLDSLAVGAAVLDVGCGFNSPKLLKFQRPDLHYVGVDVATEQDADPAKIADEYVVCTPQMFAATIAGLGQRFDAVISSHNIEHCDDPDSVLAAMASVIKPGGKLFIAWPAEHTVRLPSRRGTLNFYDDPTHKNLPKYNFILEVLSRNGLHPIFQARAYRPIVPFLIGAVLEPIAASMKRLAPLRSTWALYGFESVIWFSKGK